VIAARRLGRFYTLAAASPEFFNCLLIVDSTSVEILFSIFSGVGTSPLGMLEIAASNLNAKDPSDLGLSLRLALGLSEKYISAFMRKKCQLSSLSYVFVDDY
jgi:hypothetical protein